MTIDARDGTTAVSSGNRSRWLTPRRSHRLAAVAACAVLVGAVSCHRDTSPLAPNGSWSATGDWTGRIVIASGSNASWPSDPVTIGSITFDRDTLDVVVTFGGGCRDHAFALVTGGAWMESWPVQVAVKLSHDARGDQCRALLTRTLRFDLSPLRSAYLSSYQSANGSIVLRIAGASTSPLYEF